MSVSQRQMCEIAKAISYNAKVIVLDEPTSSLTVQEVNKLFEMMRMLKKQGIALIYISHKMDEIFEICDEISVLRDGNLVMTKKAKDTNMNELIAAMVGRSLENRFPPVDNKPGEVVLSIQHCPRSTPRICRTLPSMCGREKSSDCTDWWGQGVPSFWRPFSASVPERRDVCTSRTG